MLWFLLLLALACLLFGFFTTAKFLIIVALVIFVVGLFVGYGGGWGGRY